MAEETGATRVPRPRRVVPPIEEEEPRLIRRKRPQKPRPGRLPGPLSGNPMLEGAWALIEPYWLPAAIFAVTLVCYLVSEAGLSFLSHPWDWSGAVPNKWYDHQLYLAKAMLNGTFDVGSVGIPNFYQDTVKEGTAQYLPYEPAPAFILMPFAAIWGVGAKSEFYVSMIIGAANVVLLWYILRELNISRFTQLLVLPFFAFGTVEFYSATEGTLWFYNHVVAVFFVLIAIILFLKRLPPYLPAIALGFAVLSRGPTLLAAPFFLYIMLHRRHPDLGWHSIRDWRSLIDRGTVKDMLMFAGGLIPFGVFILWYNWARFGSPFDSGYQAVYNSYNGIPYSFYLAQFPKASRFHLFDIRNVPLHLYTLFALPPDYHPDWSVFRPSPYGLSIFFTSPAFVYAALVKRKSALKPAAWLAVAAICVPIFLHYSQGWVQYGYRFLLDFAPFLLILTALGFDDNPSPTSRKIQIALVALSILAGAWGRHWGNSLGW